MQFITIIKILTFGFLFLFGLIVIVRKIKSSYTQSVYNRKWTVRRKAVRRKAVRRKVIRRKVIRKKCRFSLPFAVKLLICGILMDLIVYLVICVPRQSPSKMPTSEGSTCEAEASETIGVIIETLNEQNKLEQHSLIWDDIIEKRLSLPPEIVICEEFDLGAIRIEYQNQIGARLFSYLPPFEDIFKFAMTYGDYYGLPDKSDRSSNTLDQERAIIDQQIRDTLNPSGCSFELYVLHKEELAIRLARMLNGYNSIDAYWAGIAAQNVFEKGYTFMSFGEALFYLTLANDLYNLSLQYNPDSYVLYQQCGLWLKLSRLNWYINDDETTEFLEKHQLQLLMISDAYGSLSSDPYQSTTFAASKKRLNRNLGEIFYTLYATPSFNITDAKQLAIDYLETYLPETVEGSIEYNQTIDMLKYLRR